MAGNYENSVTKVDHDDDDFIPPGFRFMPTDQEIMQYLRNKLKGSSEYFSHFEEVDIYKSSPMKLVEQYPMEGQTEWYFFTPRTLKYPNGHRPNRFTPDGYWKPTSSGNYVIEDGMKIGFVRTLKFYQGFEKNKTNRPTNWLMQEYTPEKDSKNNKNNEELYEKWVAVKIYTKRGTSDEINGPMEVLNSSTGEEVDQPMNLTSSISDDPIPNQPFQLMLDQSQSYFQASKPIQAIEPTDLYNNFDNLNQNSNFGQIASENFFGNELGYMNSSPNLWQPHNPNPIEEAYSTFQYPSMECYHNELDYMNPGVNLGHSQPLFSTQMPIEETHPTSQQDSMEYCSNVQSAPVEPVERLYDGSVQTSINPGCGKYAFDNNVDFHDQVNRSHLPQPGLGEEFCANPNGQYSGDGTQLNVQNDDEMSWIPDFCDFSDPSWDMISMDHSDFGGHFVR